LIELGPGERLTSPLPYGSFNMTAVFNSTMTGQGLSYGFGSFCQGNLNGAAFTANGTSQSVSMGEYPRKPVFKAEFMDVFNTSNKVVVTDNYLGMSFFKFLGTGANDNNNFALTINHLPVNFLPFPYAQMTYLQWEECTGRTDERFESCCPYCY
jgi:hypothetical protein